MKSVIIQRAGVFFGVLFFILSNSAWADVEDPGNPDTVYLECGGVSGTTVTIVVKFVTDNPLDTNRLVAFTVPLEITNSNPAAKPVLDTTNAATFSGSVVEGVNWSKTSLVRTNAGDPSRFPLQVALSVNSFSASVRAGRYLFANLVFHLQDTTTVCVDTFKYLDYDLHFTMKNAKGYDCQWRGTCCRADFSYKSKDSKSSKKQKP